MKLLFAPLEGITTRTFRNAHHVYFGGCDAYYAPFITPTDNEKLSEKTIRDIVPRYNSVNELKVQVLTNTPSAFFKFTDKIRPLGYSEVNLNLGCPSNTVCKKGRGAAFLKDVDALDRFFYEVFSKTDFKVSVKTRLGYSLAEEFEQLLNVYKKYPISLLIIHPRTRDMLYKGLPDMNAFSVAAKEYKGNICYNGNLYDVTDCKRITNDYPNVDSLMFGRGAIANPAIFRELKGGKRLTTNELIGFTDLLIERYLPLLGSDVYTLHKLKEIWIYASENYPNEKKTVKLLRKATKLDEFRSILNSLPEIRR